MKTIHVEATRIIDARPEQLYAVISDYRVGLPAILPKPPFTDLTVEKGGQGAGTVIWVSMTFFGREHRYHLAISEPEPGHVLVETDIESGKYTRFTFEPLDDGKRTRLVIDSELPAKPGLLGYLGALSVRWFASRLYKKELHILADYVAARSANNGKSVSSS
jgi:Polyketide cyclase / dehydrase and lipid transport